jgi:hypothetical protein
MLNPNERGDYLHHLDSVELKELIQVSKNKSLTPVTYRQKRRRNKDYLVIEIAGLPRCFKSTLILSSIVNLRTKNISAGRIRERPIHINKRLEPLRYTVAISNNAMHTLWEEKGSKRVLFLDRGVYDRLAFLYAYEKLGEIKRNEAKLVSDLLIHVYAEEIDGLIICNSTPGISLLREGKRRSPGPIMNKDFLRLLNVAYRNLPEMITKKRGKTSFRAKPLYISQLDSTKPWEIYADRFLKTVGSIYNLNITH